MPKATYMGGTEQYGTPQISVNNVSAYGVSPLAMAQKGPSDSIGAVADLLNTGNVDMTVDIVITHEHSDGVNFLGGGSALNVNLPIGGIYNFDSGAVQLDTSIQPGVWATRIDIFELGTTTPIPTIGNTLIPLAWQLNIVTEVSISNFAVY